ncbi:MULTISPECIES: sugar ABC transporter ATP-binding protein [Micromonospora]|uniref:Sugar ABC transporter ATP-binding protein n=1 Tax=Micromonospora solifontis TaxID=2487138 RepID=A0ABX9WC43_9ACTN|nr:MULTISPECIES: sugar ABC transporter ATP-binding protein [Micromonospora]NES16316.1 sugar ABC transporter ATP-binding protein [Micromonospora sp. PPF5-17B]NES39086.1 sugar ABC transporter ATP-binding protein [Micromonospora solifontis]NES58128.1 sugar ABC transporter ATP-binding protein [Micromonospora sp. PPF5-6]RNL91371.1 sugar ABC transporter ATP-binding protein [Micromonospora solifontis]
MTGSHPVLTMTGISKSFPGVRALDNVDFRLFPGEVHALMGENGAGKSTLIKVLTGVYGTDRGIVTLDGEQVSFAGPMQATAAGVSTVYQEVNLCTNLSVAENIFIGREPRRLGAVRWGEMRRRARALLARLDLDIDVNAQLGSYSLAVQQMVAIARAIDIQARVLVLDEPTSSLDAGEVAQLFRVMRQLRDDGIAILFVTHFLDQVYGIADRITVLRNGQLVGEYATSELPQLSLVEKMIGKELRVLERLDEQPRRDPADGAAGTPLLDVRELGRRSAVAPFSLTIHEGEVVGLAGLLGSGRTEVARLLFGADRADHGSVRVNGSPTSLRTPVAAIGHGIGFCSENRRAEGIVTELSVRENIILALQAARGWLRPLPRRRQDELVERYVRALSIRPADPEIPVGNLSGGNQQKVLLARWLITEPRLLILDEPTRGIDIGAKTEIQRLVAELSDGGMAVLFVSAELEEVLRLSHKIAVMRDREMVAQLTNDQDVDADRIMQSIAAGAGHEGVPS